MTDAQTAAVPGRTILFIGDSITAAHRNPADPAHLGDGFVAVIAEELGRRDPASVVVNRGVSGDRARDVEARWEGDCLAHEPDAMTLLIGVNDTWRSFDSGLASPIDDFSASVRTMVARVRERSSVTILLVEPFLLPVGPVTPAWQDDLSERRRAVAAVARECGGSFVTTQSAFVDHAPADPESLLYDGVHPTPAGHRLLAELWLSAWDDLGSAR